MDLRPNPLLVDRRQLRRRIQTTMVASLLSLNVGAGAQTLPPGTVLIEEWRSIGWGYREVLRSQVTAPTARESIGHFRFVYYRRERLCDCSAREIARSPTGRWALYVDTTSGALMAFDALTRRRKALTTDYVGHPRHTDWQHFPPQVSITLERYENGEPLLRTLVVEP
jgi:hypothetical protein